VITGVFPKHAEVLAHREYTTLKDIEDKRAKKEEREDEERTKVKEMGVRECWKPWQASVGFFEGAGGRWVASFHLWFIRLTLILPQHLDLVHTSRDQNFVERVHSFA
jgi:hypothetical protein